MTSERFRLIALAAFLAFLVACLSLGVLGNGHLDCKVIQLGSSELSVKEQAEACGDWFFYSPLEDAGTQSITTRVERGPVDGTVATWHEEEGWGVLESPAVDGQVWTHFSTIHGRGVRNLVAGQYVRFIYITPGQDGFPHRATSVRSR